MSSYAERLFDMINNGKEDALTILQLYYQYIQTDKADRPLHDSDKTIISVLKKHRLMNENGDWEDEAKELLNEWKNEEGIDINVLDVTQLKRGGRRRKKKSRRRRTKKKKRRRRRKRTRTKKKRRKRRRTRRKRGGMLYSVKLRASPSDYQSILSSVTDGNVVLLNDIAKSLGHTWLCKHTAVKHAIEEKALKDLPAMNFSCTKSRTH